VNFGQRGSVGIVDDVQIAVINLLGRIKNLIEGKLVSLPEVKSNSIFDYIVLNKLIA
jgi:hypothetical protein